MSDYSLPDNFYTTLSEKYQQAQDNKDVLFNGDAVVNEIELIPIGDKKANIQ